MRYTYKELSLAVAIPHMTLRKNEKSMAHIK